MSVHRLRHPLRHHAPPRHHARNENVSGQQPGYAGRGPMRRGRAGTEPVNARSALRLRLILASVFAPVFLAGTGLLWYWTEQSGPRDAPSSGSLATLTLICALIALFALVDLVVVLVRRSRARGRP